MLNLYNQLKKSIPMLIKVSQGHTLEIHGTAVYESREEQNEIMESHNQNNVVTKDYKLIHSYNINVCLVP